MKWVSIPAVLMAAVSLYVGFYYIWMYARRKSEQENLAFAVSCFTIALYDIFCAGLYNAASPEAGMFWQRLQFAALCMFTVSVSWFFYHLTSFRTRIPFIFITAWLSIFFFLGFLVNNELTLSTARPFVKTINLGGLSVIYNEVDPGVIYTLQYVSMMVIAFFLFIILIQNYRSEEKPAVRPVLIAMVLFLAASVNDVMVGAGVYPFIYLLEYAYMSIIITMANALQTRFLALHHEVEELTHQLEEKVNDRTMELLLSEITHRLYAEMAGEPSGRPAEDGSRKDDLSPAVNSLSQDISIIMNIDKLLGRSLEKGAELVGAERAVLFMIDDLPARPRRDHGQRDGRGVGPRGCGARPVGEPSPDHEPARSGRQPGARFRRGGRGAAHAHGTGKFTRQGDRRVLRPTPGHARRVHGAGHQDGRGLHGTGGVRDRERVSVPAHDRP